jgi:hypothetical protein
VKLLKTLILFLFIIAGTASQARGEFLDEQLTSTLRSLDLMRGEKGIVRDSFEIHFLPDKTVQMVPVNRRTSPTNIALDLLIQTELFHRSKFQTSFPLKKIKKILFALKQIDRDADTGLFFNWFEPNTGKVELIEQEYLSSIDNFHLAFALWVIKENFSEAHYKSIHILANNLFSTMNFTSFYNPQTKLISGLLLKDSTGNWTREGSFYYSYFGSEARSLYALGSAIGIYKNLNDPQFPLNAIPNMTIEVHHFDDGDFCLKTWDGGAFQLLLPEILASEHFYSRMLERSFIKYSHFIVMKSKASGYPIPAGISASSQSSTDTIEFEDLPMYNGFMGNLEIKADANIVTEESKRDQWDLSVSPHAVFLALPFNTTELSKSLYVASHIVDLTVPLKNRTLYNRNIGWMDGILIKGSLAGKIIPMQLALDQEMIALSILKTQNKGSLLSAETLRKNTTAKSLLKSFYSKIDSQVNLQEKIMMNRP